MKAVAYSIKSFEKEYLAKANHKKHDITLISNPLSNDTVSYAEGKDAVVVYNNDDLSAPVIQKLAALGIKFILTRTSETDNIDKAAAARFGIKISNIPLLASNEDATEAVLQQIADRTINSLDMWQLNKCAGDACACANSCRTNSTPKI
jgi:lactate dehydrogenase-like 2-hydroxyacid dehydrogenase